MTGGAFDEYDDDDLMLFQEPLPLPKAGVGRPIKRSLEKRAGHVRGEDE